MKPPQQRRPLSLGEREELYYELARLYNGWPDAAEDIQKSIQRLAVLYNEGAFTLEHVREQARRLGETNEFKTKLSVLIENRFWERTSGILLPRRDFTPPEPYQGEPPLD